MVMAIYTYEHAGFRVLDYERKKSIGQNVLK